MDGVETVVSDGSEYEQGTSEKALGIKAIDKGTVHRICSGQVVLTLATAVKELVENSIDAGATTVEVRLKEHGVASIEVIDNGKGVEEHDFAGLTLKHHTSKIRDFGDLVGVKTFGFRGEALSSLCALSLLAVTTRHTSQAVGTKLVYDHNGKLTSQTPTSRQVGTTVSLQNLFSTLPVRHKEFQRNIKKEFNKMVQVLYSYCLISTKVKLTCTNQTDKGKKTVVVATNGHPTIKENISAVYGAKQSSSMLEFQQMTATEDVLQEYGIKLDPKIIKGNELFTLEGHISSCAHGSGRSSADRQFYFINHRPCDPARVSKIVNEVYHSYNRYQFPAVVLNIKLKEDDVDINVTPDKRQILVNNEKLLLATIKTSLLCLYASIPSTYNMSNTTFKKSLASPMNGSFSSPGCSSSTPEPSGNSSSGMASGRVSALTERFGRKSIGSPQDSPTAASGNSSTPVGFGGLKRSLSHAAGEPLSKQPKLSSFIKTFGSDSDCNGISEDITQQNLEEIKKDNECIKIEFSTMNDSDGDNFCKENDLSCDNIGLSSQENNQQACEEFNDKENVKKDIDDFRETFDKDNTVLEKLSSFEQSQSASISKDITNLDITSTGCSSSPSTNYKNAHNATDSFLDSLKARKRSVSTITNEKNPTASSPSSNFKNVHNATDNFLSSLKARKSRSLYESSEESFLIKDTVKMENMDKNEIDDIEDQIGNVYEEMNMEEEPMGTAPKMIICEEYDPQVLKATRKSKSVNFSTKDIKDKLAKQKKRKEVEIVRRFKAKIAPTDNSSAEEELRKEISKDMFDKMEILGQFNLGFIICRLGSDLFIVDQHATDEKYNFETLQATYQLQNQRLIIPQNLELTAVNEAILLDNIHIFNKNGFEFKVDETAQAGRRVSLISMPVSRWWEFGREDIEELIFMLSDAPGVMCRPSRVRAMFASRSCRKSVMIGTALSVAQMRVLVHHMGEIEQPWNCPHGRPTMRHLVNLDMVTDIKDAS